MAKRVEITLKFSADLDMVPGWGHQKEDWISYVVNRLTGNEHYNTKTEILQTDVTNTNRSRAIELNMQALKKAIEAKNEPDQAFFLSELSRYNLSIAEIANIDKLCSQTYLRGVGLSTIMPITIVSKHNREQS